MQLVASTNGVEAHTTTVEISMYATHAATLPRRVDDVPLAGLGENYYCFENVIIVDKNSSARVTGGRGTSRAVARHPKQCSAS